MKEPKKNYESNFFSLLKERNNRKNNRPVNIKFVAKTSDIRNSLKK